MENFTDKDFKDFSDKLTEAYNRVVPKHLREYNNIDKEKTFFDWVERL